MYFDLNVKRPGSPNPHKDPIFLALLKELIEYGYNTIAITTEVTDAVFSAPSLHPVKKGKAKSNSLIPAPLNLSLFTFPDCKFYNRLNILVHESSSFFKINQINTVKSYDIISYQPGQAAVLKTLTSMTDFDILSYNPLVDQPMLYFSRKIYKQFVKNSVFFELLYSPTILDSTYRKCVIYAANMYSSVGRSRNVIVSSGAYHEQHVRHPVDIANLSALLSLNKGQAKQSMTIHCKNLLMHARTRRRGKCIIELEAFPPAKKQKMDETSENSNTIICE